MRKVLLSGIIGGVFGALLGVAHVYYYQPLFWAFMGVVLLMQVNSSL